MDDQILSLEHISLSYHTMKGETPALCDLTFSVKPGEFVALVGPSGCGKSTILNLISGLLKPEAGTLLSRGRPITEADLHIGYMLQRDHLFEWRTIYSNVLLGLEISRTLTPERKEKVGEMMETYGLKSFSNARPSELSGSMRQRAALIRTLAMEPDLLLLDEPFSALDYQTRLNVCDDIGKIIKKEGKTAILVTHDISEAISMADRVIVLAARPAYVKKKIPIRFAMEERMETLLAKHGLEKDTSIRRYTDYREMIEAEQPTLAAIATESGIHAEIALYCIAHGVNVIIEKPMAMSMADADAIVEAAQAHHVKVCACHQNRFNPAVQATRKALEEGRFGKLSHGSIHVRWNRNKGYYDQAPWRGTWAQDGGCMMNQCIHGVDLLRWMMGDDVVEVYAQTAQQFHHYLECEDVGMAVVKFANGAIGTIEGTTNVYPKNLEETLYLFGETGTVKIGGTSTNNIDVWQFADQREEDAALQGLQEATSNVYGNGHTAVYADMMDAIVHDRAPYIDAQAGRRALEMILAMYQSAATGMPVKLPLKDVASLDFTGRFDKKEETNG